MSSAGPPTYTTTTPVRPELAHVTMSSYFSNTPHSQSTPVLTTYDEESNGYKKQANTLKKNPSLTEKGNPAYGHHHNNYSFTLAPDNSNVVVSQSMQETKVGRAYGYLLTVSIVTRWMLFILPALGIIWIPGILSLTSYPNASVWDVRLLWWSIWLSVLWGGWWAALAASRFAPIIVRSTVGVVAVSTRKYIDWLSALHRYTALFAWSVAIWVSFLPLIGTRQNPESSDDSANVIDIIRKVLLGSVFCSGILLFEKFSIQWIAAKFHERSYAERIADQKAAVNTLVLLYRNSGHGKDNLGVPDKGMMSKLRHQLRFATTTTATVFGNVASEIAGSSVLQPNSPQAIVRTALESPNKSRLLARRIFYSFAKRGSEYLDLEDIQKFFDSPEAAAAAFSLFDQDGNGDVSREELEGSCVGFHREQLSIENSMQNLDSAVGRLDNIFMSIYVVVALIIYAAVLNTHVGALLTGAGASFLGLSWLIGSTCQEILSSIIFLFIKHPFDVGDRVIIKDQSFTVKEIRLLSTILLDKNATLVQAPNSQLTTQFIMNIRRSPQMSETIKFSVGYQTGFHDIERLREKMLAFVKSEKRDFEPVFDVIIQDISDQTKMDLATDIKYKSNSQPSALNTRRRNKWLCALKSCLAELEIYGPDGNPDAPPSVDRYTEVPWEFIDRKDRADKEKQMQKLLEEEELRKSGQDVKLGYKNAMLMDSSDAVFGESNDLQLTNPRNGLQVNTPNVPGAQHPVPVPVSEIFDLRRPGGP